MAAKKKAKKKSGAKPTNPKLYASVKAAAKKKTGPKRISWGKAKYKGGKK